MTSLLTLLWYLHCRNVEMTELVNELCILSVTWCSLALITSEDWSKDENTGWALIIVLAGNVTFNIINVGYHACLEGRLKLRKLIRYLRMKVTKKQTVKVVEAETVVTEKEAGVEAQKTERNRAGEFEQIPSLKFAERVDLEGSKLVIKIQTEEKKINQ